MRRSVVSWLAGGWLAAAALLVAGPAAAQESPDVTRCADRDGKLARDAQRIEACTAVIASGQYSGKSGAWAFNNRANTYQAMGNNDRAIADYNEAIRLDPTHASRHYNRGNSYARKKDYDRAIADYSKAISLVPPETIRAGATPLSRNQIRADYFNARGDAYRLKGEETRAISDLREALRLDPEHPEAKKLLDELGAAP